MNEDTKKAFELKYKCLDLRKSDYGVYINNETDECWLVFCDGFQAAWEIQQKRVDELELILQLSQDKLGIIQGEAHLLFMAVNHKDHEREILLRVGDIRTRSQQLWKFLEQATKKDKP